MIRTRFAPSPTGSLHIGGLRTALFNWLFARHNKGQFLLRIEDTDQKRYDPDALNVLIESLKWAGLDWDEFYVQSERLDTYQKYAMQLVDSGHAYICDCTAERLQAVNERKQREGHAPGYDRYCRTRHLSVNDVEEGKYVIRLRAPMVGYDGFIDKHLVHLDAVLGEIRFNNSVQGDTILLKSDGFPTYHLAHVVDDHEMNISHVLRAVEWTNSTPIHLRLWEAFGWEKPIYGHLPVLLNPNGKGKISKRNPPRDAKGNVIPVLVHDYINAGYLPDAVLNFLANTGWNFGDEREIFSVTEMIERFDLSRINRSSGAFPVAKLNWINGVHIRNTEPTEFVPMLYDELCKAKVIEHLEPYGFSVPHDENNYALTWKIAPLIQPRVKTMLEAVELARPFFEAPEIIDNSMINFDLLVRIVYSEILLKYVSIENWHKDHLELLFREFSKQRNVRLNDVCAPVRYALTGSNVSVPLFELMEILGREEVMQRLEKVLQ